MWVSKFCYQLDKGILQPHLSQDERIIIVFSLSLLVDGVTKS